MAELSGVGVVLCACHGRVADSSSLEYIMAFLRQMSPGIRVAVRDDLCQPGGVGRLVEENGHCPLVIGACSKLGPKPYFWREAGKTPVDPYSIRVVDLLEGVAICRGGAEGTERAKLLLWAQVRRAAEFRGFGSGNLRLIIGGPHGEVSRRDLATTLLPRYSVIPSIEPSNCVGPFKCRLCYDSCPIGAISIEQDSVNIDTNLCVGCGACLAVCPRGAVSFPGYSLEEIDTEMAGLLLSAGAVLEPRIVALTCGTCVPGHGGVGGHGFGYPTNVLPLKVPCLAMASPRIMLRAFDMGAQGLALICGKGGCRVGLDAAEWRGNVQFVKAILGRWDIEPERIRLFEAEENGQSGIEQGLQRFADEIAGFGPTPLREADHRVSAGELPPLPALIRQMGNELMQSLDGEVSAGTVHFGKVALDGALCTGCGLCALHCPTDAMMVLTEGDGGFELLFQQEACVGCAMCVDACPENCLSVQQVLELGSLGGQPSMLLHGSFMKCRICGAPFAPEAMINRLKDRLRGREDNLARELEVCPACRVKAISQR